MLDHIFIAGISFGKNCVGLVVRPYETYRRIVDKGTMWELAYIAILIAASAFRFLAPTVVTYMLVAGLLWVVGCGIGGKGSLGKVAIAWGYTLIPTACWFFMTSLLYVLFPPPRTTSMAGVAFSVLFLIVSATLFFWKLTLGYLTLRFGLKLDLARILVVIGVVGSIMGAWSYGMYRLGIFKVPFL